MLSVRSLLLPCLAAVSFSNKIRSGALQPGDTDEDASSFTSISAEESKTLPIWDYDDSWLNQVINDSRSDFPFRWRRAQAYAQQIEEDNQQAPAISNAIVRRAQKLPTGSIPLDGNDAHIVVSTWNDDLLWLGRLQNPITVYVHEQNGKTSHCYVSKCPYVTDFSAAQRSRKQLEEANAERGNPIQFIDIPNWGDEAAALLNYIIKHYDDLPKVILILHGSEYSWHHVGSIISKLQTSFVTQSQNYLNLNTGFAAAEISVCYSPSTSTHYANKLLQKNWEVFEPEMKAMPDRVCLNCCAQFAVTRSAVLKHPKTFYEELLQTVKSHGTSLEREWRMLFVPQEYVGKPDPRFGDVCQA